MFKPDATCEILLDGEWIPEDVSGAFNGEAWQYHTPTGKYVRVRQRGFHYEDEVKAAMQKQARDYIQADVLAKSIKPGVAGPARVIAPLASKATTIATDWKPEVRTGNGTGRIVLFEGDYVVLTRTVQVTKEDGSVVETHEELTLEEIRSLLSR